MIIRKTIAIELSDMKMRNVEDRIEKVIQIVKILFF